MCSAAGLTAVGSAAGAVGQLQAGQAAKLNAQRNADLLRLGADDELARGEADAARTRMNTTSIIGKQAVAYAGNGVDVTFGAPVEVGRSTQAVGELDALTVLNNARRRAWGMREEARLGEAAGQAAMTSSIFGAAGTLIGGASQVYGLNQERKV
jgi:hypothetical protein